MKCLAIKIFVWIFYNFFIFPCVFFYLMFLNIYYWENLTFSKLVGKVHFSERNARALKSKKVQGIFGKTFVVALFSSAVFRRQNCVSDFF